MKKIPCGESDFVTIRKENEYYVDKTSFIPKLEATARYVHFLRPRRYGKSLFSNMLECYYDVMYADQFDEIFGDLYIGQHPTPLHNKYLVLKFGFSAVDPDPGQMQVAFNQEVLHSFRIFAKKYRAILSDDGYKSICEAKNCAEAFNFVEEAMTSGQKLYVIIDEYDNFANTVLADSENNYMDLCRGTGFFRHFFNVLKDATTGNDAAIDRIFITGVTPLTLSDVTSGYNIGKNISLDEQFNNMVGFTEAEVRAMFEYYRDECGNFRHTVNELLTITRPWYGNNSFSERASDLDSVYNTVMTLNFLSHYIIRGKLPRDMVTDNVRTDYHKLAKIARIGKTFDGKTSVIQQLVTEGEIGVSHIKREFSLGELGRTENIVSLMFYMGLLSILRIDMCDIVLGIPNNVMRTQYFSYMTEIYARTLQWNLNFNKMSDLGYEMAYGDGEGNAEALCRYIASGMHSVDSVRDYDYGGEAFIKGFFVSQLGYENGYYTVHTEYEAGHGYSDILLRPRPEVPHGYVIELKYVKPNASDAEVEAKFTEAQTQLPKYIADKRLRDEAADGKWQLHGIVLVFRGWTLEKYLELPND